MLGSVTAKPLWETVDLRQRVFADPTYVRSYLVPPVWHFAVCCCIGWAVHWTWWWQDQLRDGNSNSWWKLENKNHGGGWVTGFCCVVLNASSADNNSILSYWMYSVSCWIVAACCLIVVACCWSCARNWTNSSLFSMSRCFAWLCLRSKKSFAPWFHRDQHFRKASCFARVLTISCMKNWFEDVGDSTILEDSKMGVVGFLHAFFLK